MEGVSPGVETTRNLEQLPPYTELTGAQARFLMGADYLDPAKEVPDTTTKETIPSQQERDYSAFNNASHHSRSQEWQSKINRGEASTTFDAQYQVWERQTLAVLKNEKHTEKIRALEKLFGKIGMAAGAANLNGAEVQKFYDRYFKNQTLATAENATVPSDVKTFVADILAAHTTDGNLNMTELQAALPTYRWIGKLFGAEMQPVIEQLIAAEAQFKTNPDQFVEKLKQPITQADESTKMRANDLNQEEKDLITYVKDHKTLPISSPSPTELPRSDRRPEDPIPTEITQDTYRAFIESKRQSDPNYNVDMAATDFLRQTGYKVGDKILLVSDSRSDPATIIEAGNKWILLLSDNTSKMDAGQLLIFGKKIVLDRSNSPSRTEPPPTESEVRKQANRLINLESGTVTDTEVDLAEPFARLYTEVATRAQNNEFQNQGNVLVLSDVAAEMIQMIAEKGNRDQKEYAFELAGINFLHNSDAIRIASYAVPASDYRNAQPGYVDYDEEIAKENMTKLAKQTKLDGIFRNYSSSQRDQGDMAGIIHVHHTGLHDRYIGMPSKGDFETALQQIQERDKVHFPWGVVTMKEGNIYMYMAQATLVDTEPTGDTLCKKLPNGKYVVFKPATIYGQHEGQMWHLGQTIDGDWQKRTPLPPPTI